MLSGLLFDRLAAVSRPAVLFQPSRCLRTRFSGSNCLACVEECQSGALTINGKAISFDEEKCTGCLRCKAICPNDALTDDIDIKLLLETIRDKEVVVLSCIKDRQCEGKIRIPCIGFLAEPLLVAINILSGKDVLLDVQRCGDCANGHCLDVIQGRLSNIFYRATDQTSIKIKLAINEEDIPRIDKKTARRFFLRDAGKAIVNISTGVMKTDRNDQNLKDPQFEKIPTRNSVGLTYALDHTTNENERALLKSYYHKLDVSEACTRCPLCTGMCPTGALKRKKTPEGPHQLVFDGSRCSGCKLCMEFCKKDALTLLPATISNAGATIVIA